MAFGYESLIDGEPSAVSAITRERTLLLVGPRELFARLFTGEDAVSRGFLDVVGGIGALPERQRDALLLNEFEGRCYADIAARLGTSESGVRGLLRRARRQLRDTAALLLPFPALRELVRSDASRRMFSRPTTVSIRPRGRRRLRIRS